jgi:uncharacterized protein (DUF1499 family)
VFFPLLACGAAALGLVLLAVAGPLFRAGAVALPTAFTMLRWAAYVGIGAIVIAVPPAIIGYARGDRLRVLVAAVGLLGGAVAFGIPFQWQQSAQSAPPIHDISTDLENPPVFQAVVPLRADAPNSLERPATLAQQQREGYPDLAPVTLPMPLAQAFDRALAAAQDAGWRIVTADRASGRIEATDTTRWFGFEDDIVVRLTPWGSGTRVDVRSVSRVGRGDVGTNARRIRSYLAELQAD